MTTWPSVQMCKLTVNKYVHRLINWTKLQKEASDINEMGDIWGFFNEMREVSASVSSGQN